MPALLIDSPIESPAMASHKTENLVRRPKSDKKRHREDDDSGKSRSHKRTKSEHVVDNTAVPTEGSDSEVRKDKKKKKKKHHDEDKVEVGSVEEEAHTKSSKKKKKKSKDARDGDDVEVVNGDDHGEGSSSRKHKKKHKHRDEENEQPHEAQPSDAEDVPEKKKKDKSKSSRKHKDKHREPESDQEEVDGAVSRSEKKHRKHKKNSTRHADDNEAADALDMDQTMADANDADPDFPFFTQIVSLYLPLYPQGFDDPVTKIQEQHLRRLVDHYSPELGGVLLAYRNAVFAQSPQHSAKGEVDQTPTYVQAVDEYAVGFGYLTAEIDLFVPSRNALMEGKVILQSEGHLGLNCWGKFNASIEANRLPRGWTYVDLGEDMVDSSPPDRPDEEDEGMEMIDDAAAEISQMHQTGYWVDENKNRVKGNLRFRIKSYEVGLQGDHGFISIEGTMLGEKAERRLAEAERENERRRKSKSVVGSWRDTRRVPEFSMTKLGKEEEEEDEGQRQVLYKGSRPGSPN